MGTPETRVVDKRMRFVTLAEAGEETMTLLCRRFGFSRRTGYKWLERYRGEGLEGLQDRSRAPHEHPREVTAAIAELCLGVRRRHPTWGPVKVRAWLERHDRTMAWPVASTIGALFDRAGLTVHRKVRRRAVPSSRPFPDCRRANDVWCIDLKGWFLTGDGRRCEPLTLSDAHSRYLLRCHVLARSDTEHVWPVLDAAFREYGLPIRLRSDNGPPFASTGAAGLSRLAVNVIKAGVQPERIEPGKPAQNGRLERLHLTLQRDTAEPPARTLRAQRDRLRAFQRVYNEERPHAALANATPAERYAPSPRRWDGVLREPEYPTGWIERRVRPNGTLRWRASEIYLTQALAGEVVALLETENGGWDVRFGPIELGVIDDGAQRLRKPKAAARGLVDNPDGLPTTPQAQQPPPVT
jgi:transposase InsO family protein